MSPSSIPLDIDLEKATATVRKLGNRNSFFMTKSATNSQIIIQIHKEAISNALSFRNGTNLFVLLTFLYDVIIEACVKNIFLREHLVVSWYIKIVDDFCIF